MRRFGLLCRCSVARLSTRTKFRVPGGDKVCLYMTLVFKMPGDCGLLYVISESRC